MAGILAAAAQALAAATCPMGDASQLWLQERLQALFSTDAFMVEAVSASLLACTSEPEAVDTIDNFLGKHDATPALVGELFQRLRRGSAAGVAAPPASFVEADGRQAHAYVKPPREEGTKPAPERQQPRGDGPASGKAGKGQRQQQQQQRKTESDEARLLWRGRVVNCLACGKVHDCRGDEAELPASLVTFLATNTCTHCGAPVLDGPDAAAASASESDNEAAASAAAAHLRLVTFDREGVGRSKLVDDQCDYVTAEEANPWLTPEERAAMRAAAAAAESRAEELARRRRTTVTIDLVGRRVLQPSAVDEEARMDEDAVRLAQAQAADAAAAATVGEYAFGGGRNAQLATDTAQRLRAQVAAPGGDGDDTQPLRMMANPGAPRTPLFVPTRSAGSKLQAPVRPAAPDTVPCGSRT